MNLPKIDWYGRDELKAIYADRAVETNAPTDVEQALETPSDNPANREQNYPERVERADEFETTEVNENNKIPVEEGEE
jgi:hypothetical protein